MKISKDTKSIDLGVNPNYIEYRFPGKVFDTVIEHLSKGGSEEYIQKVEPARKELLKEILEIPGVEKICIQKKSISVTKGRVFVWEAIEPELRSLFAKYELGDVSLLNDVKIETGFQIVAGKEEEENRRKKSYYTTAQICESTIQHFSQAFWKSKNVDANREETINIIGERGVAILDGIFLLDDSGIYEAFIMPYEVTVRKREGRLSWSEIDSLVVNIINRVCIKG